MRYPIILVQAALAFLATVHAAPVGGLGSRQLQAAAEVQTTQTTQTVQGLMTQTCTITLTPIKDANGNDAVQEVQTCTVAMSNGTGGGQTGNSAAPPTNNGGTPSSSGTTNSTNSSGTTSSSGTSSGGNAAGVVDGTTLVPASAATSLESAAAAAATGSTKTTGTSTSTTSAAAISGANAAGVANGASQVSAVPSVSGSASSAAGTAAAASAPAQAFTLPGKKLSVLPIGLGVFAGISVIALIVVGLVTYERTKYRKAFRQRKLAEAGSAMGYGGMAQRT